MPIAPGSYALGPELATLTVNTRKGGAAAIAGHNLRIEVTSWSATLDVADDAAQSSLKLTADGGSLRVVAGTDGAKPLGEGDKRSIKESIDSDVLKRTPVAFQSRSVTPSADGGTLTVAGELELVGTRAPLTFDLHVSGDGRISAAATVKQSDWGIKPFSALFGTLKVLDEVQVTVDGRIGRYADRTG